MEESIAVHEPRAISVVITIRAMFWFFLGETAKELIKRGCIKFFEIMEKTK